MSLTGYMREGAVEKSVTAHDVMLDPMRELAAERNIIIITGAPLPLEDQLYSASIVFYPDGRESIYTKQYLHEGEEKFFSSPSESEVILYDCIG